jgi:hypothetical protein
MDILNVVNGYLKAALWASTDGNELLDRHFTIEDFSYGSHMEAQSICLAFVTACQRLLDGIEDEQIGHDLWLTRNHHGTGFWDRGLRPVGDQLSAVALAFGEDTVYVGDDRKLHFENEGRAEPGKGGDNPVKFVVRCEDFETSKSRGRDEAESILEKIETDGHCPLPHEIVEVPDNYVSRISGSRLR